MTDTEKTPYQLVRFVRNADDAGTGALRFNDDDRPDLEIGKAGWVTETELYQATALGVTLEQVDGDDGVGREKLAELGIEVPPQPSDPDEPADPNADLKGASKKQLEDIAAAETPPVNLSDAKNNEQRTQAIIDARSAQPEGVASLPAGSTASPGAPVAPSTSAGSGDGTGSTSAPA